MSDTKTKMTEGLFSSRTEEWATPVNVFQSIEKQLGYKFVLDVCATEENAKCKKHYTKEIDGLLQSWQKDAQTQQDYKSDYAIWMNPPYGKEIGKWMKKALNEAQGGTYPVVCLVHARTDTKWWHDYAMQADKIYLVKGRIKFGGKDAAPFPSCIVVFKNTFEKILNVPTIETISFKGENQTQLL